MIDFICDWLRGAAVCLVCAILADLAMAFGGWEQIELWRQVAFVLGAPLVVAAFMVFASRLAVPFEEDM